MIFTSFISELLFIVFVMIYLVVADELSVIKKRLDKINK